MRSRLEVLISVRDDGKDSGKSRRRRAREMTTHVGIEDHRQTYFELKEDGACHAATCAQSQASEGSMTHLQPIMIRWTVRRAAQRSTASPHHPLTYCSPRS